ncbi:hypothetical protein CDAR_590481 [Caerostris darwini]|uniref:Cuticle protein n=1 Tax=Caerostris darwini TaxID=1538125 RepID=A0AAV4TTD2_9ARAC|nr:hypothetical protein CDAR_590481 [Caerostris darwini]
MARLQSGSIKIVKSNSDDLSSPTPYQFSYSAPAIGGGSTHEESGDAYGRKTGTYTVQNEDGSERVVQYVADEDGFRASISTNEPGTANQNPADVTISSSADEGIQTLTAPASAVIPVAPSVPVAPPRVSIPVVRRYPTIRQPFNSRRIRPFIVPFRPSVIPFPPPTFIDQPVVFPFGGPQIIPQDQILIPVSGPSPLIPIADDIYRPDVFLPY